MVRLDLLIAPCLHSLGLRTGFVGGSGVERKDALESTAEDVPWWP